MIKVGDYCKHFKGSDLIQKNIYQVLALNATYTGVNADKIDNLVVYKEVFENLVFVREYNDLFSPLSKEKQIMYNQTNRVEKLSKEELEIIKTDSFKVKKLEYINNKRRNNI